MGLGYALDIELGLLQPYYQWQWLSVPNLRNIQQADDLLTETTFTPNRHKVGLDFILNKEPFKDISRSKQKVGGTFQANVSYLMWTKRTPPVMKIFMQGLYIPTSSVVGHYSNRLQSCLV